MTWKRIVLVILIYASAALLVLLGVLWISERLGASRGATTLIAALGGALAGTLGPVAIAAMERMSRERETDERIRDEASRVALELTRIDYELRQQALSDSEPEREFLAPAKVYREFYRAVVDLRTKDEWPHSIQELGLLNVFTIRYKSRRPES